MASRYSVCTGQVATTGLAAAGKLSLWLINPATDGLVIAELWLSIGAVAAQSDIAFELYRTTTLGSPTGTSRTIVKEDPNTAATSATALVNLTAEPTTIEKLREWYESTLNGKSIFYYPLGREPLAAAAGGRVGLRVVNDAGGAMTSVDTRSTVVYEEQ